MSWGIRFPMISGSAASMTVRRLLTLPPHLTSIHIHGQIMGYTAANLLMTRIEEPSLNYRTVYTETNLILRESTGD